MAAFDERQKLKHIYVPDEDFMSLVPHTQCQGYGD